MRKDTQIMSPLPKKHNPLQKQSLTKKGLRVSSSFSNFDSDLAQIIEAWSSLSDEVKSMIVKMIC